jgi:Piwi domain
VSSVPGWRLTPPRLRFDAAFPSRAGSQAYQGVRAHGPFDSSRVSLGDGTLLFVFPVAMQAQAHRLAQAWLKGVGSFPGFEAMFRVPVATGQALKSLPVATDLGDLTTAAREYRDAISAWSAQQRDADPLLALVLVPHSERWQTERPYYEAKAAFANLGIPSQMVTTELIADEGRFQWAVADIALASFAKLGGIPWTVEAPSGDDDLIVGIGRRDVGPEGHRRRIFGYAVTFISNGVYRQTWSFTPAADETAYLQRLQDAVQAALAADLDTDPQRLVIHLSSRTGHREIEAVRAAMRKTDVTLPTAFLRLDDTILWDAADTDEDTWAAPKGLVARLGPRKALLHAEELTATGPPDGPLLVELDERSTVGDETFDEMVAQVFRLAHANWRGFNARSKPATLVYGEELAGLVGHLADVDTWNPDLLRSDLRNRPWFL